MASAPETPSALVVVVVEDELLIRMAIIDVLTEAGFAVIEAAHAEEALAALTSRAADIDVLLTDVRMPGPMDGLELAHHTRKCWPWVALLIVSGEAPLPMVAMPVGSRFLPKPYSAAHVIAQIRELALISE